MSKWWWSVQEIRDATGVSVNSIRELITAIERQETFEIRQSDNPYASHKRAQRRGWLLLSNDEFLRHFGKIIEAKQQERAAHLQRQLEQAHLAVERRTAAAVQQASEAIAQRDLTRAQRVQLHRQVERALGAMPPRYLRRLSVRRVARRTLVNTSRTRGAAMP